MADVQLRSVIRQLRRIIAAQRGMPSPSDTQLLQAFIDHRDESAVEMLIWRHGTMILNLCRRVLQDEHHAEDAFQATFLVLVRKARSIGKRQSVGSWLCKVAYRIAHRQRASLAKQPELLPEMNDLPEREPAHDLLRDVRSILDEEIDRLPEKYRSAIVLRYLQGHSTEEAAELLGCPPGTILSRLSRGREQLRYSLAKRGLALSASWLATHLSMNTSSAAVPALLVDSTTKAAMEFAAGKAASGLMSSSVAALTQGVLHAMFVSKLKIVAAVAFTVIALTMGAGSVIQWAMAGSQPSREVGALASSAAPVHEQSKVAQDKVVERARQLLEQIEKNQDGNDQDTLKQAKKLLELRSQRLQDAVATLDLKKALDQLEAATAQMRKAAEDVKNFEQLQKAAGQVQKAAEQVQKAFEQVQKAQKDKVDPRDVRLKALRDRLKKLVDELKDKDKNPDPEELLNKEIRRLLDKRLLRLEEKRDDKDSIPDLEAVYLEHIRILYEIHRDRIRVLEDALKRKDQPNPENLE